MGFKIAPKTVTLDYMDRATLVAALELYQCREQTTRGRLKGRDQKSRDAIERVEMELARTEDLLNQLRD